MNSGSTSGKYFSEAEVARFVARHKKNTTFTPTEIGSENGHASLTSSPWNQTV